MKNFPFIATLMSYQYFFLGLGILPIPLNCSQFITLNYAFMKLFAKTFKLGTKAVGTKHYILGIICFNK